MVRLYRTFSLYIVTGETRSAGCLGKRSGWFKHSEPQRTYSNHPELVYQHPTHRALWDGVVRVGSLCLNHPDLVHKHPTHLASSVVVCFL